MNTSLNLHQKAAFILSICLLSALKIPVNAADFYKYLDHNGTVVFKEDILDIPLELRDKVEKITLPDNTRDDLDVSAILENFSDAEQLKTLGKKKLHEGKVALRSFLQDQKILLAGYIITGILLFMFLSRMLKSLGGHNLKKIIFKVVFIAVLFCGTYFWYLSYLNKNILSFDLDGKGNKGASNPLTTPTEMLKKTLDMIDQINTRTEKKQEFLDNLE